jgi:DNA (cytosine-5)-methyltransferase 1
VEHLLPTPTAMDSKASGGGYNGQTNVTLTDATVRLVDRFGVYAPAIARWEPIVGRPAPEPTVPAPKGGRRLSARFVEWMLGLPDGWVTGVPGLSYSQQLKILGNGCVPAQVALAISLLCALDAASTV